MILTEDLHKGDVVYDDNSEGEYVVMEIATPAAAGGVVFYLMGLWDEKTKIISTKYKAIHELAKVRKNLDGLPPERVRSMIQYRIQVILNDQVELEKMFKTQEGKVLRSFLVALTEVDVNNHQINKSIQQVIEKIYTVTGLAPTANEIYSVLRTSIAKNLISDEYLKSLSEKLYKESYKVKSSGFLEKARKASESMSDSKREKLLKNAFFAPNSTPDKPQFGGFLRQIPKDPKFDLKKATNFFNTATRNPKDFEQIFGADLGAKFRNGTVAQRENIFARKLLSNFGMFDGVDEQTRDKLTSHYLNNSRIELFQLLNHHDPTGKYSGSGKYTERLKRLSTESAWANPINPIATAKQGKYSAYGLSTKEDLLNYAIKNPEGEVALAPGALARMIRTTASGRVGLEGKFLGQSRAFLTGKDIIALQNSDNESEETAAIVKRSMERKGTNPKLIIDPSDPYATLVKNGDKYAPTTIEKIGQKVNLYNVEGKLIVANERFNPLQKQILNYGKGSGYKLNYDKESKNFSMEYGGRKVYTTANSETSEGKLRGLNNFLNKAKHSIEMDADTSQAIENTFGGEQGYANLSAHLSNRSYTTSNPIDAGYLEGGLPKSTMFLNDSAIGGLFEGEGFKINSVEDIGSKFRLHLNRGGSDTPFHLDLTEGGLRSFLGSIESHSTIDLATVVDDRAARIVSNLNPFNKGRVNMHIPEGYESSLAYYETLKGHDLFTANIMSIQKEFKTMNSSGLVDGLEKATYLADKYIVGNDLEHHIARSTIIESLIDPTQMKVNKAASRMMAGPAGDLLRETAGTPTAYGLAYSLLMADAYESKELTTFKNSSATVTTNIRDAMINGGLDTEGKKTFLKTKINLASEHSVENTLDTLSAQILASAGAGAEGFLNREGSAEYLRQYGLENPTGLRNQLRTLGATDYSSTRAESLLITKGLIKDSPELQRVKQAMLSDTGKGSLHESFVKDLENRQKNYSGSAEGKQVLDEFLSEVRSSSNGLSDLSKTVNKFSKREGYQSMLDTKGNDRNQLLKNLNRLTNADRTREEISGILGQHSEGEINFALEEAKKLDVKGKEGFVERRQIILDRLEEIRALREVNPNPVGTASKEILDLSTKAAEVKARVEILDHKDIAQDIGRILEGTKTPSKTSMRAAMMAAAVVMVSGVTGPKTQLPYTPRAGETLGYADGEGAFMNRHEAITYRISGNLTKENLMALKSSVYDSVSGHYILGNYTDQHQFNSHNPMEKNQVYSELMGGNRS